MQSPETEDRWYVDVGGTPKMMTLDELVASFEAGVINSKTLVTEVGGSEWKPLKEVADLGDDEEAAPPSVQAPAAAQAAPSVAPAPVSVRSAAAPAQSSYFPPAAARATLSAWPPVVASQRPTPSVSPGNSPSIAPPATSPTLAPVSTTPVVQDLNFGLDAEFKPRKSKAGIVGGVVVVAFIGGLFGVSRLTGGGEVARPIPVPAAAPVALNTATSNPVTTPEPAAAPTPAPTTTTPSTSDSTSSDKPSESASNSRLSDDTKSKLKDADKTRADKKKAAKAARGHAVASKKASGSSGVFRNGGNANDPLNAKL